MPGPWTLLAELGRSRTGLALVAVLAFTLLGGLAVMTLRNYSLCVQLASVSVDFSPADSTCSSNAAQIAAAHRPR